AAQGEKIVTLDGAERQLTSEMLVIADARRPVAIAGVMGGKDAEVSFGTKRVLLESAWFDPISIRRTSRNLKLASDSSYRFERGVDLEQVASCARRAAALIVEAAGGYVVWGPVDKRFSRNKPKAILWEPEQARALGEEIPPLKQRKIFLALGCRITGSTSRWKVAPPSFRADLKEPVDLLEELARLTGYQNFPTTLPRPAPTFAAQENREGNGEKEIDLRGRENKIRRLLVAGGLDEILTYSLIGPDALQRFDPTGSLKKAQQLFLQNPLSVDLSILRPTLLIGALETVARNFNRRAAAGMALFELGRTYHWDAQGKPEERRTLSIALAGLKTGSWNAKPSCWDLYDAKGILDALSERLGGKKLHWRAWNNQDIDRACPWFRPETVTIGDDARAPRVAWIGITDSRFTAFEIPSNVEVVLAEVGWQACWAAPASPAMLVSLPKVAPVTRDIAVVLDEAVPYSEIASCIRLAGGSLVQKVHLFDQYRGSQVPSGKKSLAYTVTYAAGDRTLTDDEVNQAHASIVEALRGQFAATLRS
ncbi:MAG: phenylalanine--tRNA ligase subunit beta, partial [Candidatus Omnitrophica bacterium]|nr:phenylalanine--tRNA ligase subunit beta [Candidatus Omnitrophota bacterium]